MKYRTNGGTMRDDYPHTFTARDLGRLDAFLGSASGVVPVRDAAAGTAPAGSVVMRHDVDHNLDHAIRFAEWEAARGYRASYYVLHSAWYWEDRAALLKGCHRLASLGHEVGLHQDAVAEAYRRGDTAPVDGSALPVGDCASAAEIVAQSLALLRDGGIEVVGTATHGTGLWREAGVTNVFLWATGYTAADFGLEYADAYHLHRLGHYISDNHGAWSLPLRSEPGRLTHILAHPCHWDMPRQLGKVAA